MPFEDITDEQRQHFKDLIAHAMPQEDPEVWFMAYAAAIDERQTHEDALSIADQFIQERQLP